MHILSVKTVLWLAVNLHHLFSDGAAINMQSRSSLTSYTIQAQNRRWITCDSERECLLLLLLTCFKGHVCFSKNLFMSIRHMKKRNTRFPLLLFLCTEQFTDTNPFTFLQDRAAHFFWTFKMYIAYIVYYYICLPLCAHILYFDAAIFSIKQF